jgi:hypothetical protein
LDEFSKAPDGQPTSSIERMLSYAKEQYYEWENTCHEARERVERAEEMMKYWDDRELELEYQLAQRRSEVTGL